MNITEMNIGFLNSLNTFLIATEEKIIAKAKVQLPLLESKLRGIGSDTTDYEYFVEIDYFTDASNGNPIYYLTHAFTVENLKNNNWGLLGDGEDWREDGWLPQLNNRCCYLMHELVYHAKLNDSIFDINKIWVDTKIWDQSFVSLKTGKWEPVKWDN